MTITGTGRRRTMRGGLDFERGLVLLIGWLVALAATWA
jgi:hypothetical protein